MVMTKEEKILANKEYRESKQGKMIFKINKWKQRGLICENREEYEYIYDRWLYSEKCEEPKCNKEYTEYNKKNMDHCHLTGLFRDIICHSCNMKRTTKDNNSGIPNIYKNGKGWQYQININGNKHSKRSNDLEWLKNYKIEYENKYLYI